MNYREIKKETELHEQPSLSTKALLTKSAGHQVPKKIIQELEDIPEVDRRLLQAKKWIYEEIVTDFSLRTGKEVSKKERQDKQLNSASFTYGEIDFKGFAEIFYLIKKKYNSLLPSGGRFYDLGSGLGKGVIAAAILHDFSICIGIELLDSLSQLAVKMKDHFNQYMDDKVFSDMIIHIENDESAFGKKDTNNEVKRNSKSNIIKHPAKIDWDGRIYRMTPEVIFECDNILKKDWIDGTFILANSTCFDAYLMWQIAKKARFLSKNTIFVTITKRLPDYVNWELLECYQSKMSWGDATVYIQLKKNDPTNEDKEIPFMLEEKLIETMQLDNGENLFSDER